MIREINGVAPGYRRRCGQDRSRAQTGSRSVVAIATLAIYLTGCVSEVREQQIGDAMVREVNPRLPIIDDPLLNAYVHAVGDRIAKVSSRPDLQYDFYIVNTPEVNAFALPGGHIYLTRGLIERTKTGDEFAGILAHEIGHVAARHGVRKIQRQLRTGSVVSMLYNTILGGEPELLRENSLQLANAVWSAKHSRQDELEADLLAVEYLAASGGNPEGVLNLLETLLAEEEVRGTSARGGWFATHPVTSERIAAVREAVGALEPVPQTTTELDLGAYPAFHALVTARGPYEPVEPGW